MSNSSFCTSNRLPCTAHAISSDKIEVCFGRPTSRPVQQSNLSPVSTKNPCYVAQSLDFRIYPRILSSDSNATLSKAFPATTSRLYAAIGVSIWVGPSGYFSNFCFTCPLLLSASCFCCWQRVRVDRLGGLVLKKCFEHESRLLQLAER